MNVARQHALLQASRLLRGNLIANKSKIVIPIRQQTRNSSHGSKWTYRKPELPEKPDTIEGIIMTTFWWWILWHIFTEYHELLGPTYPDPSKWTDEELGIPPI